MSNKTNDTIAENAYQEGWEAARKSESGSLEELKKEALEEFVADKESDDATLVSRIFDRAYTAGQEDSLLLKELIHILINHVGERGDNEGAVEVLNRIIKERDDLAK